MDGFSTMKARPGYLILEKLHGMPTGFALDVKDGICAPLLCIVAGTFTHPSLLKFFSYLINAAATMVSVILRATTVFCNRFFSLQPPLIQPIAPDPFC